MSSFKSNLSSRKAIFSAVSVAVLAATSTVSWADASLDVRSTAARADRNAASVNTNQVTGNGQRTAAGAEAPVSDEGTTANRGGSGDAVTNWNNAAGGAWATGTNWSGGAAPSAADDAIFNLGSTYSVSMPAGAVASTTQVNNGVVSMSGGTLLASGAANPGVGATVGTNAATSLSVGHTAGQTGRLNISGGTVVDYFNAYSGLNVGATGILDISGAGTLVAPTTNGATGGRFGVMAGTGTINVRDGAEVQARLFEFGRQDGTASVRHNATVNVTNGGKINLSNALGQIVMPRASFANATLSIDGAGSFVHAGNLFSGDANSQSVINITNGGDLTGGQFTLNGDGTNATLNMSGGGTATYATLFTGGTVTNADTSINMSGAGTRVRITNVFVDQGGSLTTAIGTTNVNLSSGAVLSVGRMNGNQDAALAGATSVSNFTIDGVGSKLEALNSVGSTGTNSYLSFGGGAGNGTANSSLTNIIVRNGGSMTAADTDGDGGIGYIAIGGGNNGSTTNLTISTGGSVSATGQLTISDADRVAGQSGSLATVNVTNGSMSVGGSAFVALDTGDIANVNIGSGGLFQAGTMNFGGGNLAGADFSFGGGTTNLNVTNGGDVLAETFILARDRGDVVGSGAQTNIIINGAGSSVFANGVDDTLTAGIDDGYFTTSVGANDEFGFPIPDAGDASFVNINIAVQAGGLLDANEAAFIGDTKNGSTTISVTGAGSTFDSGRQLSINTDGLESSVVNINISNGGVVKTTGSVAQTTGSIFVHTSPAAVISGSSAVTISLTDAGSKLESSASIFLGGTFDANDVETTGLPVTVTAGAGTSILAAGSLDLASNSTMNTAGTVSIAGVSTIGGTWTASAGAPSAGTLNLVGAGQVSLTNPTAASATLLKTDNTLIAATAKADIGKNAMRIRPEGVTVADTDLSDVKNFLALGRVGPGTGGITSTALTANMAIGYKLVTAAGTFLGDTTATGDILVRATLKGDTDLNGAVSFDDLLTLAQAYNAVGTGEWYTGDSTFDGNVNFDDLLALAQNYGTSLLAGTTGETVTGSFAGDWNLALSMVPEPTSIAALGMGAALLGRRRSR